VSCFMLRGTRLEVPLAPERGGGAPLVGKKYLMVQVGFPVESCSPQDDPPVVPKVLGVTAQELDDPQGASLNERMESLRKAEKRFQQMQRVLRYVFNFGASIPGLDRVRRKVTVKLAELGLYLDPTTQFKIDKWIEEKSLINNW